MFPKALLLLDSLICLGLSIRLCTTQMTPGILLSTGALALGIHLAAAWQRSGIIGGFRKTSLGAVTTSYAVLLVDALVFRRFGALAPLELVLPLTAVTLSVISCLHRWERRRDRHDAVQAN